MRFLKIEKKLNSSKFSFLTPLRTVPQTYSKIKVGHLFYSDDFTWIDSYGAVFF